MKNSIILPKEYKNIFLFELRKSGLIKPKDNTNLDIWSKRDNYENLLYRRRYKLKQNLFQMILLYDELVVQYCDSDFDYEKIKSIGNFKLYLPEDYYSFDPVKQENNSLYAYYLKPAMFKVLKNGLKPYFEVGSSKISYNEIVSELYDTIFKIKNDISKETIEFIRSSERIYKLRNWEYIDELKKHNASKVLIENGFLAEIVTWFHIIYYRLCLQLKISSENESFIVNSEFQLSKIGCEIYEENINTYMEAYKIIKCECANIIGALPHMDNIQDVILLKKERKNDIKNLQEVIGNLENVLRTEGREQAILKAANDVKKAADSLAKHKTVCKIGEWTTLLSVPIGIAEMLLGGGFGGMGLSIIGAATCLIDKKIERDNSWCEIVR